MNRIGTETVIQDWRYGQVQAERLCAELLHLEGYQSVDPQCPLGGPDGLKDVLCRKDGEKWIAAAYFPPTRQDFTSIEGKFSHDLEGVRKNDAKGIVFFVNQPLTPGNRSSLVSAAMPNESEIYHLERIRAILDSPKGYGARLEYLRISMTEEEQLGFFSVLKDDLTERFKEQEESIIQLHRKMDSLMMQTTAFFGDFSRQPSSLLSFPDVRGEIEIVHFPTASLSIGQLRWLHRIITDDSRLPSTQKGHFRSVAVWIGPPGATPEEARFVPAPPEEVLPRTTTLLEQWRKRYPTLIHATPDIILEELTAFHHGFLSIHPFLDANGRVARAILQQQTLELLRRNFTAQFNADPQTYYEALYKADQGNRNDLRNLIRASLE
jgi:fido (protein-threonine AMPylation protein)